MIPAPGSFQVTVEMLLTPGHSTFLDIVNTREYLTKLGYAPIIIDSGKAGKITAPETRRITWTLGTMGGTQAKADRDVKDALINAGLWDKVKRYVTVTIPELPSKLAEKVGEQAGAGIKGVITGAGAPLAVGGGVLLLLLAAVVVGVGVVAFKRG